MITRLIVEHYRSIGQLDVQLGNTSIFVGPNATGKSNIIDSIRLLKDAMTNGLDRAISDRQGIDTIRQWSPTRPYHVTLEIELESRRGIGRYRIALGSKKGNFIILGESGQWSRKLVRPPGNQRDAPDNDQRVETVQFERSKDGKIVWKIISDGQLKNDATFDVEFMDELFLRSPFPRVIKEERLFSLGVPRGFTSLDYMRREISDFEAYSIFPNTLRTPQNPTNDERMHSDGSNFASVFRALTRNKVGQQSRSDIIDSVRALVPTLQDISVHLVGGFLTPVFRVVESDGNQHEFNVSQMSDGTLRMLGLLTALYHPNRPQILALEEPEQTVNPGILLILADAIKAMTGKSQVLVTTHSPSLIDYFDVSEIYAVGLSTHGTTVNKVKGPQLDAVRKGLFSAGELMIMEGLGLN